MADGYAIVENGKVVNVVVAEADFAAIMGWIKLHDNVGIGWYWTPEGGFTPPWEDPPAPPEPIDPEPEEPPADPPVDPVPETPVESEEPIS